MNWISNKDQTEFLLEKNNLHICLQKRNSPNGEETWLFSCKELDIHYATLLALTFEDAVMEAQKEVAAKLVFLEKQASEFLSLSYWQNEFTVVEKKRVVSSDLDCADCLCRVCARNQDNDSYNHKLEEEGSYATCSCNCELGSPLIETEEDCSEFLPDEG